MENAKFYVIEKNVVANVIVCSEEYAARNKLIKFPVETEFGIADTNWTYLDGKFLPPPRDILSEWEAIRLRRNMLLQESDMFVLPDRWASYSSDEQEAWSMYRQELRDLPSKFIDPKEVVFPTRPDRI